MAPADAAGPTVQLLLTSLAGGGAETSTLGLRPALEDRGIRVVLTTLKHEPGPQPAATPIAAADAGRLARIRGAVRLMRQRQPDLVHTTLFEADLVGRVAARRLGLPVVTSLVSTPYDPTVRAHEPVSAWKLEAVRRLDGLLARHATTAFHAITEVVAQSAVRHLGVPRERIHVVPRGRDPEALGQRTAARRQAARQRLGVDPDTPMLVAVGREEPQKNHALLLRAFAELQRAHPDAVLVIAGRRGRASAQIDDTAADLGLAPPVLRRLGARDDVADLLVAADVFAFPSRWEGLGGAALEAMALRAPIVAADIPAFHEVLDGGRAALLADPDDPHAWSQALAQALAHGPEIRERVDHAEARFHGHYTLARSADGMAAFDSRVLDEYGAPARPTRPTRSRRPPGSRRRTR